VEHSERVKILINRIKDTIAINMMTRKSRKMIKDTYLQLEENKGEIELQEGNQAMSLKVDLQT